MSMLSDNNSGSLNNDESSIVESGDTAAMNGEIMDCNGGNVNSPADPAKKKKKKKKKTKKPGGISLKLNICEL